MNEHIDRNTLNGAIADSVSTVAAAIGFTGGFTYVAGYLVVGFYLSQYGVSTLSLLQARYFAAGGLYIIVSTLISAAPLLSMWLIDRELQVTGATGAGRNRLLLLFAASLILAAAVTWIVHYVLTEIDESLLATPLAQRRAAVALSLPVSQIALITPAAMFFLARWWSLKRGVGSGGSRPLWILAVFASTIVVSVLISLFVFGRFVYPFSTPALGGGAPTRVQLALSDELSARTDFPLQVTDGMSEPVLLLDQSANSLLVLRPGTRQVLEIADEQVLAVVR
jgi:hypothetical protein